MRRIGPKLSQAEEERRRAQAVPLQREDRNWQALKVRWVERKTGKTGTVVLVRAGGLEPPQALRPNGFSCHLRLLPPPSGVCGLDYPFTLPLCMVPRFRCCPSSLYTFPGGISVRARLGIAM